MLNQRRFRFLTAEQLKLQAEATRVAALYAEAESTLSPQAKTARSRAVYEYSVITEEIEANKLKLKNLIYRLHELGDNSVTLPSLNAD